MKPFLPIRRATILNASGVVILLIGLVSAWLVYQGGSADTGKSPDYAESTGWQDGTIPVRDSKVARYQLEKQLGPVGVLMVNLWEDLRQPGPMALLILVVSAVAAGGCFLVSRYCADLDGRK